MENQTLEIKDKFSNDEMKELKKTISELHENELIEVFKIIKNDTDKFTENRNGIFINMSKLNVLTLIKLQEFVNFCNENKKSFQFNKNKMYTIKNLVSEDNESISLNDNESIENNTEIEYQKYENYYTYDKNPQINFNEIETSILKERVNINEKDKNIKKKKYTENKKKI